MRALCFLIAQMAGQVAGLTDQKGRPLFHWRTDPFFFRAFKLAVAKLLDALEPVGEMRPPQLMLDAQLQAEGRQGVAAVKMFKATYETPEARANNAVETFMSFLMRPSFDEEWSNQTAPNHTAKVRREYYGFLDARRDLQLKGDKS
jgi:hypothetical protein